MIGCMGRRARASITLLLAALLGAAPLRAQSAAEDGADSGWFGDTRDADPSTPDQTDVFVAPPAPSPAPSATPAPAAPSSEDADPRALTEFKPALDPYGSWVDDPNYGTVWMPYGTVVGADFQPYVSGGHWALSSDDQWVWVSDYPFGWVTFHYGRWVWISGSGWAWIPGYTYAPAWVAWRVPTDDYYGYVGWAPYGATFGWFGGVAIGFSFGYPYYWAFCPSPYVFYPHVHAYMVQDPRVLASAAYHTRVYSPASPHPRTYGGASPSPRTPVSPPPGVARVPAGAVPRERVSIAAVPRAVPGATGERFAYDRRTGARAIASTATPRAALPAAAPHANLPAPGGRVPASAPHAANPAPAGPAPAARVPAPSPAPARTAPVAPPTTRHTARVPYDVHHATPAPAPVRRAPAYAPMRSNRSLAPVRVRPRIVR